MLVSRFGVILFMGFSLGCAFGCSSAQPRPEAPATEASATEVIPTLPSSLESCNKTIDQQQRRFLQKLQRVPLGTGPQRLALFDVLTLKDDQAAREMSGMAVLMLRGFSNEPMDFGDAELRFVSFKSKAGEPAFFRLPRIFPHGLTYALSAGDPARSLLGNYRTDLFYFVPEEFLIRQGELRLYLGTGATSLLLSQLPKKTGVRLNRRISGQTKVDRPPSPSLVMAMIRESSCLLY